MNFSSISEDINLTKDITEIQLIEIIDKFISYFYKLENLNPIKLQLTKNQCNSLLFTGTLYDSLGDLAEEHALNYGLIVKHQLENYETDGHLYKITILDNIKAKRGGLNYVTEFILFSKNGSEYLNEIRGQYKKYSNKENYVNTIKTIYSNIINNFTVNNFLKCNPTISDSTYFNGQFVLQSIFEECCLGSELDTYKINICLDSILKLETNVSLEQYFSVTATFQSDGTQLSLYFLNYMIHVINQYGTLDYLRLWDSFLREKIYSTEFIEIFYSCINIPQLYNSLISFLENYLKCVEIYEDNVAGVSNNVDDQYQLFSKIMFKDVARLCFLFSSKRNTNRLKFLDNLKNLCSVGVHRLLCLKMLNYKK